MGDQKMMYTKHIRKECQFKQLIAQKQIAMDEGVSSFFKNSTHIHAKYSC